MHEHHSHEHATNVGSREEAIALLKYMANHNESHTRELAGVASSLKASGDNEAYDKIVSAIEEYEKGNANLKEALEILE